MSWVAVGIAAVGAVSSLVGASKASKAAKKAAKAQKQLIRIEADQQMRTLYKQRLEMLGTQKTGYAAAGVDVSRGTPALVEDVTNQSYTQAHYFDRLKEDQLLKGASNTGSAASSGYISQGISQAASSIGTIVSSWPQKPLTPTPSPGAKR